MPCMAPFWFFIQYHSVEGFGTTRGEEGGGGWALIGWPDTAVGQTQQLGKCGLQSSETLQLTVQSSTVQTVIVTLQSRVHAMQQPVHPRSPVVL